MAKRKPNSPAKAAFDPAATLEDCDARLVALLNERAALALRNARAKAATGDKSLDFAAEQRWLRDMLAKNPGPLDERSLRAVLRELQSACRRLAQPTRVAFLGPEFSYSHLAAIQRFGHGIDFAPVSSIAAVFEEVSRRQVDYGLAPIENSTDGRIVDTLDMFARLRARVCGEVQLRVHHYLLGKCPRGEVREVYSRPQALSQCRGWLAKHLPDARQVEMTSTAAAAQLAAEKPGAAAVASLQAGVNYGLGVLAEKIEDNRNNVTRFAIIGDHPCEPTGRDKTSLMFEIAHKPGALADAIAVFKKHELNMTWIESFPMPGAEGREYLFFVELEGHERGPRLKEALDALLKKVVKLTVLGSYPQAELLE